MPNVLEIFNQKTVLDYLQERQFQTYDVGEALFPEVKYDTLDFEYIVGANELPAAAKVHAFDTEAEIGSVEAAKQALEAAYIKKKYQIKEKDLIELANPRTSREQQQIVSRFFNLIDKAVGDVRSAVELMRMQALANGQLTLNLYNGTTTASTITVDYGVPANHKETLAGGTRWNLPTADILGDIRRWSLALPVAPTRAVTSRKIVSLILSNPGIISNLYGTNTGRTVASIGDLNAFMQAQGLPIILPYENTANSMYREQQANGTYVTKSYFPDHKFVMIPDGTLGETLYGPTPEESRLVREGTIDYNEGNVIAMIFEEGLDPISTWAKAATTAIPSFPMAQNVFQAQPIDAV